MSKFKVGDKVTLTPSGWRKLGSGNCATGKDHFSYMILSHVPSDNNGEFSWKAYNSSDKQFDTCCGHGINEDDLVLHKSEKHKFEVGDKVKIIQASSIDQDFGLVDGMITTIVEINPNKSALGKNYPYFLKAAPDRCMGEDQFELHVSEMVSSDNLLQLYGISGSVIDYKIASDFADEQALKLTQHPIGFASKESNMNKITTFIKNALLSKEEKLMRKWGLKTDCGEYTDEARQVVLNKLCAEKESELIKIAEGLEAESKEE